MPPEPRPRFTKADATALYDVLCPWDSRRWPSDAFYDAQVRAAASVLDVGCGTGAMLHTARANGHTGRLTGLDPDEASLARARRRTDVEWVHGKAAGAAWDAEFALATMTGHAFQCLVTDEDLRTSLTAVRAALRPGGRFVFETRHPQARAWERWTPEHASDVVDATGRPLRVWHETRSVRDGVVTFTETTAEPDGRVLYTATTSLRFLEPAALDALLHEAGFAVEAVYGDWERGPLTASSSEIVTVARRP